MTEEKPKTNVLSLVRDDVDHTKAYRLGGPSVFVCGVKSEPVYERKTASGTVYATTTCRVVIEHPARVSIMTVEEARKLADELRAVALLANRQREDVSGFNARKIKRLESGYLLQCRGEEFSIRKQRRPKPSIIWHETCHECRVKISTESWVSDRVTDKGWGPKRRVGEIRICVDCFPKLIVDNEPLQLVRKP